MSIDPDSSLRDNLHERKIEIPINLLDCENCESTKQNGDDASLMRFFYTLQIGYHVDLIKALYKMVHIRIFLSFALEKFSSYPNGPELPLIGFDSPMNLTHPYTSFHKETVVKSGTSELG